MEPLAVGVGKIASTVCSYRGLSRYDRERQETPKQKHSLLQRNSWVLGLGDCCYRRGCMNASLDEKEKGEVRNPADGEGTHLEKQYWKFSYRLFLIVCAFPLRLTR